MSSQLSAHAITAHTAMTRISVSRCSTLPAQRGSARAEKCLTSFSTDITTLPSSIKGEPAQPVSPSEPARPFHASPLGLRRLPPGPELAGDTPPLGAVLVPPEDGLDRLPQVVVRHLAVRPDLVDQRLQLRPPRVCQNVNARVRRHPRQLGIYLRG